MPIRLSRFEMPKRAVKDEIKATETYAKFVAEPFEVGYGRTIGNSLRRVLLSSIEGAAITSVRITGAEHEFCSVSGIVEDVTDIILNLKKVLLKTYVREPRILTVNVKGPGEVTAGDIQTDGTVEILNPDAHIATLSDDGRLEMKLEARIGRGFCPAEWNKKPDQEIGRIPIDSIFSPVRRVNFYTENTRVGQKTDYDKLVIEIWTDGRVTPDDALTMSAAILRHHLDVFVNYDKDIVEFEESEKQIDAEREELRRKLNMSVNEIELSVRAANCLNNANITTVGQLAQKTEADMLKYRNFGKKSLNEIKGKLVELGLALGMTFEPGLLEEKREIK
ncbi:MAG: DNA-directed RNA polymerase subunit alpha [Kiritimatiellae bacterium]|nr:DNA-directed RNA polymerase subunit alpha [Kiritimatiellia bacterium]MDD5522254.1 DNA-directed RNA polymerase subunit alpha [Kiritimatiellia bacterium]